MTHRFDRAFDGRLVPTLPRSHRYRLGGYRIVDGSIVEQEQRELAARQRAWAARKAPSRLKAAKIRAALA
jgi:hypothetical protein